MNLKYHVISELSKIASILYANYKVLLTNDKDNPWGVQDVYLETADIIDWEEKSTVNGKPNIEVKKQVSYEDWTEIKNYQKPLKEKYKSFSVDGVINKGDRKGEKVKLEIIWSGNLNTFTFSSYESKSEVKKKKVIDMVSYIKNYVEPKQDYLEIATLHEKIFIEGRKFIIDEINKIIKEELKTSFFKVNLQSNGDSSLRLIFDEKIFDKEKQKEISQKFENNIDLIKNVIFGYAQEKSIDKEKFDVILKIQEKSIILKLKLK